MKKILLQLAAALIYSHASAQGYQSAFSNFGSNYHDTLYGVAKTINEHLLLNKTDAHNRIRHCNIELNKNGKMSSVLQYDTIMQLQSQATFNYNKAGNIVSHSVTTGADPAHYENGNTKIIHYHYNALNQLERTQEEGFADAEIFTYTPAGKLAKTYIQNAPGCKVYSYDADNKLQSVTLYDDLEQTMHYMTKSYQYDKKNNLTQEKWIENGSILEQNYTYDSINNCIEYIEKRAYIGANSTETKLSYTYDSKNNIMQMLVFKQKAATPTRTVNITYTYDLRNNWTEQNLYYDTNLVRTITREITYYE